MKFKKVSVLSLAIISVFAALSCSTASHEPSQSNESPQNEPIQIVSVPVTSETPGPNGRPLINVEIKNISQDLIVYLQAFFIYTEPALSGNLSTPMDFSISPSAPFKPGRVISSQAYSTGVTWTPNFKMYYILINGRLENGKEFSFRWDP